MDRFIILLDPGATPEMCVSNVFYTLDAADEYAHRYLTRRPYVIFELTASGIRRRSPLAETLAL